MFNRLMRCISTGIKQSNSILPGMKIRVNSKPQLSMSCDLFSIKSFCNAVSKSPNIESTSTSTSSSSPLLSDENQTEEIIPDVLKAAFENDPALLKRYKILQLEIDVMRHAGKLVPDSIKPIHWLQLLKEETRSARRRYLQFLFTIEKKQENMRKKKELARIEREKLHESSEPEDSDYRLHKVAMFMRIYDTTMNQFYHSRLIQAMQHGEKLVIDCGYYEKMTPRECTECAKQLAYMFAQNRLHREPFDLHFCNVNKSSLLMQRLHRIMPTIYEADFPLNICETSYTEVFDRNKLVYLTPHCNNEMKDYEPDSVYIIGAIVDKTNSEPLSLARAKKDGLRMAKLPLDKYLLWGAGSGKRLPLNQMVNILTDLRTTGDWQTALRHVPRRKLEKSLDDYKSHDDRREKVIERNYKPAKQYEQRIPSSFSFKDRQKRSFNK